MAYKIKFEKYPYFDTELLILNQIIADLPDKYKDGVYDKDDKDIANTRIHINAIIACLKEALNKFDTVLFDLSNKYMQSSNEYKIHKTLSNFRIKYLTDIIKLNNDDISIIKIHITIIKGIIDVLQKKICYILNKEYPE